MYNIPFNIPTLIGNEIGYLNEVFANSKFCGDGPLTEKCHEFLKKYLDCENILLTTSCTHAIEMSALLLNVKEGDEVIMPSYTFVSSANPFVLRGAKIIFVDIDPMTMNIDPFEIEKNITENTKLILVVHYAGVSCDMDKIMNISKQYNIPVVEDSAQCMGAFHKGRHLGTIGDLGCISFHETKNIHCGEGGALIINNKSFVDRAEVIREKGTNRRKFLLGQIDKYSWVDLGSSYLPSELNAAFLYGQLLNIDLITKRRRSIWQLYFDKLSHVKELQLPIEALKHNHNGHIFYIKVKDVNTRNSLLDYLKDNNIQVTFHYVPLHSSIAGQKFGVYKSENDFTSIESARLIRLPNYFQITDDQIIETCNYISRFYQK